MIDLIPLFFGEDSKTVCVVRDPQAGTASMLKIERKKKRDLRPALRKTPDWFTANDLVSQVFRERRIVSDFFMYLLESAGF